MTQFSLTSADIKQSGTKQKQLINQATASKQMHFASIMPEIRYFADAGYMYELKKNILGMNQTV